MRDLRKRKLIVKENIKDKRVKRKAEHEKCYLVKTAGLRIKLSKSDATDRSCGRYETNEIVDDISHSYRILG